jgi:hypothetical protein
MATSAAKKPTQTSSGRSRRGVWQSILVYPTLAIALITAVPQWIEKYQAYRLGIVQDRAAAALKQNELWAKNLSCSAAPFAWYNSPNDVKIDATICNSGDIFVQAVTPDNKRFMHWVPLDDIVTKVTTAEVAVIPAANAATLPGLAPFGVSRPAAPLFHRAQTATVLCQKFLDNRRILRRIQTPEGCFDEIIDTFNGTVVEKKPAPCVAQC